LTFYGFLLWKNPSIPEKKPAGYQYNKNQQAQCYVTHRLVHRHRLFFVFIRTITVISASAAITSGLLLRPTTLRKW
jgi:hypothetical protein